MTASLSTVTIWWHYWVVMTGLGWRHVQGLHLPSTSHLPPSEQPQHHTPTGQVTMDRASKTTFSL